MVMLDADLGIYGKEGYNGMAARRSRDVFPVLGVLSLAGLTCGNFVVLEHVFFFPQVIRHGEHTYIHKWDDIHTYMWNDLGVE